MTASNAFTPTGIPRRRLSDRTPRERLLRRMAQDRREHVRPMPMQELVIWMADHVGDAIVLVLMRSVDDAPSCRMYSDPGPA